MGGTSPADSAGSKPKFEPKSKDARAPGAKSAVEEAHHAKLIEHEQTISSLDARVDAHAERMDAHADETRELIVASCRGDAQRLTNLEAEVASLKSAVASLKSTVVVFNEVASAAAAVVGAAPAKAAPAQVTREVTSEKTANDPVEGVLTEAMTQLKAAEARANRGAEALADSMKQSAKIHMRVQALEGLMQDVLLKTSTLAVSQTGSQPSFDADSVSSSFARVEGPSMMFQRERGGVPPLDLARSVPGFQPPSSGASGGYRIGQFAASGLQTSPGDFNGSSPMGSASGSPGSSQRFIPEKPPDRRPGTCSAWWS